MWSREFEGRDEARPLAAFWQQDWVQEEPKDMRKAFRFRFLQDLYLQIIRS